MKKFFSKSLEMLISLVLSMMALLTLALPGILFAMANEATVEQTIKLSIMSASTMGFIAVVTFGIVKLIQKIKR